MIEVRAARPHDYDRVGELTVVAYRELPVDHLFGGYDEKILDTASRARDADVLVAVADDAVIGAVTYVADHTSPWSEWTEPGEAQFRLLAVDPGAGQRGAGTALVTACLARATAARQPLLIHTTTWMAAAQRMYARFGFVPRPDRDARYETWAYEIWPDSPDAQLPPEWRGQPFLAYAWHPPT